MCQFDIQIHRYVSYSTNNHIYLQVLNVSLILKLWITIWPRVLWRHRHIFHLSSLCHCVSLLPSLVETKQCRSALYPLNQAWSQPKGGNWVMSRSVQVFVSTENHFLNILIFVTWFEHIFSVLTLSFEAEVQLIFQKN